MPALKTKWVRTLVAEPGKLARDVMIEIPLDPPKGKGNAWIVPLLGGHGHYETGEDTADGTVTVWAADSGPPNRYLHEGKWRTLINGVIVVTRVVGPGCDYESLTLMQAKKWRAKLDAEMYVAPNQATWPLKRAEAEAVRREIAPLDEAVVGSGEEVTHRLYDALKRAGFEMSIAGIDRQALRRRSGGLKVRFARRVRGSLRLVSDAHVVVSWEPAGSHLVEARARLVRAD